MCRCAVRKWEVARGNWSRAALCHVRGALDLSVQRAKEIEPDAGDCRQTCRFVYREGGGFNIIPILHRWRRCRVISAGTERISAGALLPTPTAHIHHQPSQQLLLQTTASWWALAKLILKLHLTLPCIVNTNVKPCKNTPSWEDMVATLHMYPHDSMCIRKRASSQGLFAYADRLC